MLALSHNEKNTTTCRAVTARRGKYLFALADFGSARLIGQHGLARRGPMAHASEGELEALPVDGEKDGPIPPRQLPRFVRRAVVAIGVIAAFGAGWLAHDHYTSDRLVLLNPCPVPRTVRFFDALRRAHFSGQAVRPDALLPLVRTEARSSKPVFVLRVPPESRTELSRKYHISPGWSFDVAFADNAHVGHLVSKGEVSLGVLSVPLCEQV